MYIYVELFTLVLYMSQIIIEKSKAKDKKLRAVYLDSDGKKKFIKNFGDARYS